jgi:dihydroneopterin aldolase
MIRVQLHHLVFRAFHGIHEEERILGNEYHVEVALDFNENTEVIDDVNDTIDYSVVYDMIRKRMQVPTPLLETVVMRAGHDIHARYPQLKAISISLKKLSVPIEGMQGAAEVTWHKEF